MIKFKIRKRPAQVWVSTEHPNFTTHYKVEIKLEDTLDWEHCCYCETFELAEDYIAFCKRTYKEWFVE